VVDHQDELIAAAVPDWLYRDEMRWYRFLEEGGWDQRTGWKVELLSPEEARRLRDFIVREYGSDTYACCLRSLESEMPRFQCPCCDFFTLDARGEYDICPICFWEDDGIDIDRPDSHSGPNHKTLREGRHNFQQIGACDPEMLPHVLPQSKWSRYQRQERSLTRRSSG
jgi:hypothetical protein